MSSNYIIECRNLEAQKEAPLNENGDWTTNLQEKITLEEGDSIICRNAFCDSRAFSNSKIVVEKDTTLHFEWVVYVENLFGAEFTTDGLGQRSTDATNSAVIPFNNATTTSVGQNDGRKYIMCEDHTIPGGQTLRYVDKIDFNSVYAFQGFGNFWISVRFTNKEGVTDFKNYFLPEEKNFSPIKGNASIRVDIIYDPAVVPGGQTRAIEVFVKGSNNQPNLNIPPIDNPPGGDADHSPIVDDTQIHTLQSVELPARNFIPKVFGKDVVLKANNYDPIHLCVEINRLLTETGDNPTGQNLADNNFLTSVGNGQNLDLNNFVEVKDETYTGNKLYGFNFNANAKGARVVGASQVVLDFKTDTNNFEWSYLHFPVYSDKNEAVGWGDFVLPSEAPVGPATPSRIGKINKNAGIMWNKLASSDPSGNEVHFWTDMLGFETNKVIADPADPTGVASIPNPKCILTNFKQSTSNISGSAYQVQDTPGSVPIWVIAPQDGITTTGGFQGIDTAISKSATFFQPLTLAGNEINTTTLFSTTDTTDTIEAGASVISQVRTLPYGYFLVEVTAQFRNNYVTTNQTKGNVVAIMSRYYDKDSYTSSGADASLVYTHSGVATLLNSFKCRILDSDKNLADNIGPDNTIFLEVVKAQKKIKSK